MRYYIVYDGEFQPPAETQFWVRYEKPQGIEGLCVFGHVECRQLTNAEKNYYRVIPDPATAEYRRYLKWCKLTNTTTGAMTVRDYVLKRDEYTCVFDRFNQATDVHHAFGRMNDTPEAMVSLCSRCHRNVHDGTIKREKIWKEMIRSGILTEERLNVFLRRKTV